MRCNGMPFFPANFMLQTSQDQEGEDDNHRNLKHHQQQQPPIFQSQDFNGVAAFLGCKRLMPISGVMEQQNGREDTTNKNHGEDEASDDESMASGDQKKRRLNMEQVKVLEKSFEMGNKLEPERKAQLARALGLQPRQIAIWFQNRRARWKTKQLEKDYDALKRQFDAVTAHNESLQAQSQELQSQILALTSGREGAATGVATESFNLNKETIDQGSCSNRSENSSDQINNNMVKLDMSKTFKPAGGASDSPGQIPTSMPLFPTSSSTTTSSMRPSPSSKDPSATQLFFHHNQQHHSVKEEHHYSNMFCGIEDQSGFWPWLDQQHNFH